MLLGFYVVDVESEGFVQVFGGNVLYVGMQLWVVNYGGYQFGYWVGQFGDGCVILLGELVVFDG